MNNNATNNNITTNNTTTNNITTNNTATNNTATNNIIHTCTHLVVQNSYNTPSCASSGITAMFMYT